ncbi:glutaredoxin [Macadamia integrifolia]|uniref:glutaredoxin n=1 Tax=Macadamia integrifolia TaxID=60698 RepID=UPI001C4F3375|nr:glutaredoxin [Macadamia integrifolia]
MGAIFSSSSKSGVDLEMALSKAKEIVSSTPVVVFSKTYCGYCTRVKQLLSKLGATYKVIELNSESDGGDIQAALREWTGQRTVPNVFIGGNHIGGCDAVTEKHQQGKLVPLLTDAGALASTSSL